MATEMVLVPKSRYERLVSNDKELQDKIKHYEELLKKGSPDNSSNTNKDLTDGIGDGVKSDNTVTNTRKQNGLDIADARTPIRTILNSSIYRSPLDTLTSFEPKFSLYGKRLLKYIKKNGGKIVGWDEQGVITYRDNILNDTNVVDMIEAIFKKSKNKPKGYKEFKQSLNEINVPKAYLKPSLLNPPGIPQSIKKNWKQY
jgi:hypothetical protein